MVAFPARTSLPHLGHVRGWPRAMAVATVAALLAAGCVGRPAADDPAGSASPTSPDGLAAVASFRPNATATPGPGGPWLVDVRGNATFVGRLQMGTTAFHCILEARTFSTYDAWARHLHVLEVYVDGQLVALNLLFAVAGRVVDIQVGPISTGDPYDQYVAPVLHQVQEGPEVFTAGTLYDITGEGGGEANVTFVYTIAGQGLVRESAGEGGDPVRLAASCDGEAPFSWQGSRNFTAWAPGDGEGLVGARGASALGSAEVVAGPSRDVVGRGRLLAISWDGVNVADVTTPDGPAAWVFEPGMVLRTTESGPGLYSLKATGANRAIFLVHLADLHPIATPLDMYDPISGR